MTLYIIGGVLLLFLILLAVAYNSMVGIKNQAEEAFSTMDIYMKKRFDLIPNLVETVKGYATHERDTLEKVIQARNQGMNSKSIEDKQASENMMASTLKSLFAVTENYPDLKADRGFQNLQEQLESIETDIAQSRKYYNAVVKTFNTKTAMFPKSILTSILGFKKYPYFTIENHERQNVQVKF